MGETRRKSAALPSVARLVRYTGLSERTVRTCLDQLAAEASSHPAPRDIVAAQIKRADHRPQCLDLDSGLVRDDLDDAAAVLGPRSPGPGVRLAAAAQSGAVGPSDGKQSLHLFAAGSQALVCPCHRAYRGHRA